MSDAAASGSGAPGGRGRTGVRAGRRSPPEQPATRSTARAAARGGGRRSRAYNRLAHACYRVSMAGTPRAQTPLLASLALVALGVVIAAVGGITKGSLLGGAVSALGVVPAAWGAWAGMQKET